MNRVLTAVITVAVVLVAGVGAAWALNWRAERAAEIAAAHAEVRTEILALYEELEEHASQGGDAAAALHLTLQEHLTITERTDEELTAAREAQEEALVDAGRALQRLSTAPAPSLPELADPDTLEPDLEALEEMQSRAAELGESFSIVAASSNQWAVALRNLREHADRYVETVEGQPDTSDPARLRALWEEEREVLEAYHEAATLAAEVPGLAPLAEAYLDYVEANLEFAEEAVALLEENEIDAYNERLRETYGDEDPFGFQAAVASATERSFDTGVLAQLVEARDEASTFTIRIAALSQAVSPGPAGDPAEG